MLGIGLGVRLERRRGSFGRVVLSVLAAASIMAAPGGAHGQQMQMRMGGGSLITLPGGRLLVLASEAGGVVVRGVVDQSAAAVGGAVVDLAEGDRIVSFEDLQAPTAEQVVAAYDAIPEGAEVEMRVERDGVQRPVRFIRPAPTPSGQTMVVTDGAGGAGAWTTLPAGGGAEEVVIAGAHIRNNDQGMPAVTFRGSDGSAALVPLRVGDVIIAVNGRGIAALAGLELFYNPLAPGDEVTLRVIRNGVEETLTFRKPDGG